MPTYFEMMIFMIGAVIFASLFLSLVWLFIGIVFVDVFGSDAVKSEFAKRWPPIDDDEFVRRCNPGVDREIALRVRRVVSIQLDLPYEQIYPEQSFVDDLECC